MSFPTKETDCGWELVNVAYCKPFQLTEIQTEVSSVIKSQQVVSIVPASRIKTASILPVLTVMLQLLKRLIYYLCKIEQTPLPEIQTKMSPVKQSKKVVIIVPTVLSSATSDLLFCEIKQTQLFKENESGDAGEKIPNHRVRHSVSNGTQFAETNFLKIYNDFSDVLLLQDHLIAQLIILSFPEPFKSAIRERVHLLGNLSVYEWCCRLYTGDFDADSEDPINCLYDFINDAIITDDPDKLSRAMILIRCVTHFAVHVTPDLDRAKPQKVWRKSRITIQDFEKFEVGAIYRPCQIVSTTLREDYAENLVWHDHENSKIIIEFVIPKECWQYANVAQIAGHDEDEVLVVPYSPIKIEKKDGTKMFARILPASSECVDKDYETRIF